MFKREMRTTSMQHISCERVKPETKQSAHLTGGHFRSNLANGQGCTEARMSFKALKRKSQW